MTVEEDEAEAHAAAEALASSALMRRERVPGEPPQDTLHLAHAFGVYPAGIKDAVMSHGEDAFLFCVGRHIALCDHTTKRMIFLPRGSMKFRTITAATRAASGRYIALAEHIGREDGVAQISVHSLPKPEDGGPEALSDLPPDPLRVLVPNNRRLPIVDLAFSSDAKFLVSLSAGPDFCVTYWRWEAGKAESSHDIRPSPGVVPKRVQVNPKNNAQMSISGNRYLRLWEYNPNDHNLSEKASMFPGVNQEKEMVIVDHCWVQGLFLCAATQDGFVHLFEDGEHRQEIDIRARIEEDDNQGGKAAEKEQARLIAAQLGASSPGMKEAPPIQLYSLALWGEGFVVGGDSGYLGVFKVSSDMDVEPFGTFRMPGEEDVLWSMTASSEDTYLTILSYKLVQGDDTGPVARLRKLGGDDGRNRTAGGSSIASAADSARGRASSKLKASAVPSSSTSRLGTAQAQDNANPGQEKWWQLTTFPVGNANMAGDGEAFVPIVTGGAHNGKINGMGSGGARRTVVTCGMDKMLKVWGHSSSTTWRGIHQEHENSFVPELSLQVCKFETPRALAMHPLGFQCAVILEDSVRIYHLTVSEATRTLYEMPLKNPGDVAYSNQGQLLAVTSINDVVLIDPWRATVVYIFSGRGGHLSPVNQVMFSADDHLLLSCASSPHGAIYGWDLESEAKERKFEHVSTRSSYSCFAYDFRHHLVVAVVKPMGDLRIIGHLNATLEDVPAESRADSYTTVALAVQSELLFAGTTQGAVRIFTWPFTPGGLPANPYREINMHAHPITSLTLSVEGRYLFSACSGGAIFACILEEAGQPRQPSVTELNKRYMEYRFRGDSAADRRRIDKDQERKMLDLQRKLTEAANGISTMSATMDDLVFVPKNYYMERLQEIRKLLDRVENLQHEHQTSLDEKEREAKEKMQTEKQERQMEKRGAHEKYDKLFMTHQKATERHAEALSKANREFEERISRAKHDHEKKLAKEIQIQTELAREMHDNEAAFEEQRRALENQSEETLAELQRTQEKLNNWWKAEYDKVCALLKSDGVKFEEALTQQEKEYEQEIADMIETKRRALQVESERSMVALKDGVNMKQCISMLQKQLKAKDEELAQAQKDVENLRKKDKASQEFFHKLEDRLKERDRSLKVKDDNLANLRAQMKHLESFRFVLYHKVKTLEEERDPLEEQLSGLKTSVKAMYEEFVREFRDKQNIDQELDDKKTMAKALQSENKELRSQLIQLKKDGRRLLQDVETVLHAENTHEFENMPKRLQDVVGKHQRMVQWAPPSEEDEKKQETNNDNLSKEQALLEEMFVQRDLLFRKNQIAVSRASQAKRECARDFRQLTSDNATLIHEMNQLRAENQSWKQRVKVLESEMMGMREKLKNSSFRSGTMQQSSSAPDLQAGSTQARGQQSGDTPYMRRKVVDQQELYRRQMKKASLPPVSQGMGSGGPAAAHFQKQTLLDKRFAQTDLGRRQFENQGYDMTRLGESLPLEHPPRTVMEDLPEEESSFPARGGIQT